MAGAGQVRPTAGIQGKYVSVSISEAVFEEFDVGMRYVMSFVVRNVSMRGQRVRLVPPRHATLNLSIENDVEIAPGLDLHAELSFSSNEPKDVIDQMVVSVGRAMDEFAAEQITIPIRALAPAANLQFETSMDFGMSATHDHPASLAVGRTARPSAGR